MLKWKAFISSLTGALLCFWYMVAIVGIDVHVDHHDGEVFVVSLLNGTDCESVHPDDICHCLEHHHGHCHADDEDCENEVCYISITGDGFDFVCDFSPVAVPSLVADNPAFVDFFTDAARSSAILTGPPRAYLRNLCVLRV